MASKNPSLTKAPAIKAAPKFKAPKTPTKDATIKFPTPKAGGTEIPKPQGVSKGLAGYVAATKLGAASMANAANY
jgi:hypothetical protein